MKGNTFDLVNYLKSENVRVAVSLSSGGAEAMGRNLALMEMLTELEIPYDEIHGSSAGAPVAAMYGLYNVKPYALNSKKVRSIQSIRRTFSEIARYNNLIDISGSSLRAFWQTRKPSSISGLFSGDRIEDKMKVAFEDLTFDDLQKDVFIYAEKENKLHFESFNRREFGSIKLHEAIRASISLPHFFESKSVAGENYIDGGLLVNSPLRVIHDGKDVSIKKPLFIFASTGLYPFETIDLSDNLWDSIKNRYFYKVLSRMFHMELEEALSKRGVYVLLFYPQMSKIKSFSFNKLEPYLEQSKKNFYGLYHNYLKVMRLAKIRRRVLFKPGYNLEFQDGVIRA